MKKIYLNLTVLIVCIVSLVMLISLVYFTINFYGRAIPPSIEKWGQLGDYLGGTLNPLIAIINVGLLVYLTFKVSDLEEKRQNKLVEIEERRHLNEFRNASYIELNKIIDEASLGNIKRSKQEYGYSSSHYLNHIRTEVRKFKINNFFLFRDYKDRYNQIFNSFQTNLELLRDEIQKEVDAYEGSFYGEEDEQFLASPKIEELYQSFNSSRNHIKIFIQKVILDKAKTE